MGASSWMGSHIDFTSSGAIVCSLPFRAVSFVVCAVYSFASLNSAVQMQRF